MPRSSPFQVQGLFRTTTKLGPRFQIDLRYREPDGSQGRYRERLPVGTTLSIAKARAAHVLSLAVSGQLARGAAAQEREARTFGDALDAYMRWVATNRPRSERQRRSMAGLLRDHFGAGLPLMALDAARVEQWKGERQAQGASAGTINRNLGMLQHAVGLWSEWAWLDEATASRVRRVKKLKEPPGRVRFLSDTERARLLAALAKYPTVEDPILFALHTGLRRGSIVGLLRQHVDVKREQIVLPRTKNDRPLAVPLSPSAMTVLRHALARADALLLTHPDERSGADHVFLTSHATPWTPDGLGSLWQRVRAEAKLRDFRLHDLRHHFASSLRRHGVGIDAIARLLGHATIDMSTRYAHLHTDTLRAAVRAGDGAEP